jgi:hypothetical protein
MIRRLRLRARPPDARSWPVAIAVTSGEDGLTHCVTDAEMDAHDHMLRAVCGCTFLPAALAEPPGPDCSGCATAIPYAPDLG